MLTWAQARPTPAQTDLRPEGETTVSLFLLLDLLLLKGTSGQKPRRVYVQSGPRISSLPPFQLLQTSATVHNGSERGGETPLSGERNRSLHLGCGESSAGVEPTSFRVMDKANEEAESRTQDSRWPAQHPMQQDDPIRAMFCGCKISEMRLLSETMTLK